MAIRQVHFKGGKTDGKGGAISVSGGDLTLESCIFSDNSASRGSVINHEGYGILKISGCTFYKNSSNAVFSDSNSFNFYLFGNLFYDNPSPIISYSGTLYGGTFYNVIDIPYGTGNGQSGWVWTDTSSDTTFNLPDGLYIDDDPPFNQETFVPVSAPALRIIPTKDSWPQGFDFPATDFYGKDRVWPGVPGAVNAP